MRWNILVLLLLIGLLNACQEPRPSPSLKGAWIQAGQFFVAAQDSIWERKAVIWEFTDDSTAILHDFQLGDSLTQSSQKLKWQQQGKMLILKNAIQEEAWSIEYQDADSLVLGLPNQQQPIYWVFSRMRLPQQAQTPQALAKTLKQEVLSLETDRFQDLQALQWEAIGTHFIHPNLPQSWRMPLRWGTANFKGQNLIAIQALLSGQANQWELAEVISQKGSSIVARYFKNGQPQRLSFEPSSSTPFLKKEDLLGTWQASENPVFQQIHFEADSVQMLQDQKTKTAAYWLSQTAPLLFFRQGYQFHYSYIDPNDKNQLQLRYHSPQHPGITIQLQKKAAVQ